MRKKSNKITIVPINTCLHSIDVFETDTRMIFHFNINIDECDEPIAHYTYKKHLMHVFPEKFCEFMQAIYDSTKKLLKFIFVCRRVSRYKFR